MHTRLKGKIICHEGVSYQVLADKETLDGWIQVRSIGPDPKVMRMTREHVQRCLPTPAQIRG
jgi:hypothetical protein